MWKRKTLHECADELLAISQDFRAAHINKFGMEERRRNQILQGTSERGVEILRTLALSVRSEEDYGIIPEIDDTVGAIKPSATDSEVFTTLNYYRPPILKKKNLSRLC